MRKGLTKAIRIRKVARDILNDSKGPIVALCVLKGGHSFYADLLKVFGELNADRDLPIALQVEFVRLQSYVNEHSTGQVKITGADLAHIAGKVTRGGAVFLPPILTRLLRTCSSSRTLSTRARAP